MSQGNPKAQSAAQTGSSGQATGVGPEVGVLRSSEEAPVMGVERRRDTCLGVRNGRGRRLRKEISLYDAKSPTLTVATLANGVMEPDSESRIREIRSSGLMRGEVAGRTLTTPVSSIRPHHFACSTLTLSLSPPRLESDARSTGREPTTWRSRIEPQNPPPAPPKEGRPQSQFPSLEGSGVGSGLPGSWVGLR